MLGLPSLGTHIVRLSHISSQTCPSQLVLRQKLRGAPEPGEVNAAWPDAAAIRAKRQWPRRLSEDRFGNYLLAKGVALDIPASRPPNANEILVTGAITV
jgi:hypothetical protein